MPKLVVTDFKDSNNSFEQEGDALMLLLKLADIYGEATVNENFKELLNGEVCKIEMDLDHYVNVSLWG